MDFGSALTYQFRDPRWQHKFLLAALLSLIPVFGQLLILGWSLAITRRVMNQETDALPELDLSTDLLRGLKGWGISLVYSLPALLLAIPLSIGLGLMIAINDGRAATVWALAALCLTALLIGYSLVLGFILPAAYATLMAQNEQFSAGLNLRVVLRLLRRGPVAYFMVFLGGILCAFITIFGLVGCIIGVVLTSTYSMTVMAHLFGQAYLDSKQETQRI